MNEEIRSQYQHTKAGIKPVVLIGAGGHARILINMLKLNLREIVGCLTADGGLRNGQVDMIPVLGGDEVLDRLPPHEIEVVNGIGSVGDPGRRVRVFEDLKGRGYCFTTVIHPSAVIAADAIIGEGVQVMAGAVVQPGCHIGVNVIINTGAVIDHDCRIGDHVHIAPGAVLSGNVQVGLRSHIGTAAAVIQGIAIGESAMISAGAVVVRDVPPNSLALGVPARVVSR